MQKNPAMCLWCNLKISKSFLFHVAITGVAKPEAHNILFYTSGAAAVALDKPKASAKSAWTSGVTMAQRLRAEAAAQVEQK